MTTVRFKHSAMLKGHCKDLKKKSLQFITIKKDKCEKSEWNEFHDEHHKLQIGFIATRDYVQHIMLAF